MQLGGASRDSTGFGAMEEAQVRSLGGEDPLEKGHGNPLQYSCLENAVDRGAWQATVHRTTHSQTQLKRLITGMHTSHRHAHLSQACTLQKQVCQCNSLSDLKVNA